MLLPTRAQAAPVDSSGLGSGRWSRLHVFLEKTFLDLDILRLDIKVDQKTANILESLVKGQKPSAELEGRIVAVVLRSANAYAELEFLRSFSTSAFVEGIKADVGKAYKGKLIDASEYERVRKGAASWFAFLGDRGVEPGDKLYHRGSPSGLRSVYVDSDGAKQLDIVFKGAPPTRTLLATYLAPGGELREPLVRSLFDERTDAS